MTRSEWATLCDAQLKAGGINNFSALEICDVGRESNGVVLGPPGMELLNNAIKHIMISYQKYYRLFLNR